MNLKYLNLRKYRRLIGVEKSYLIHYGIMETLNLIILK